ncbi:hypothetical protein SRABI106_04641 [Rahnella aquatilis]|nr:hypothetical protein SRABI106_04641 [Rahnella aquatilis]
MGDPFQRIGNAVGEIVHRIDAPFFTGLVMFCEFNTVQNRITHDKEWRGHIDFCTQTRSAFGELTVTHFFK